jgi:hypothetical protein
MAEGTVEVFNIRSDDQIEVAKIADRRDETQGRSVQVHRELMVEEAGAAMWRTCSSTQPWISERD